MEGVLGPARELVQLAGIVGVAPADADGASYHADA